MTRMFRCPTFVMAALAITSLWFASSLQAGAPTFSPAPAPRHQEQPANGNMTPEPVPPLAGDREPLANLFERVACDTRDSVVTRLGRKYGETRRGIGMAGPTAIFEIWASDKPPHTWTILKTAPNGLACIMAVGDGWHDDTGEPTPTGNPA